jgi:hypothetical protein
MLPRGGGFFVFTVDANAKPLNNQTAPRQPTSPDGIASRCHQQHTATASQRQPALERGARTVAHANAALQLFLTPAIRLAEVAHALAFADLPPEAAGPTWTLAAACAGFLGAVAWAVRWGLSQAVDLSKAVTADILKPVAVAHVGLMQTLQKTLQDQADRLDAVAENQRKMAETVGSAAATLARMEADHQRDRADRSRTA